MDEQQLNDLLSNQLTEGGYSLNIIVMNTDRRSASKTDPEYVHNRLLRLEQILTNFEANRKILARHKEELKDSV